VDGLFESLIMLSISGIFFLNVFWSFATTAPGKEQAAEPAKPPPASEES